MIYIYNVYIYIYIYIYVHNNKINNIIKLLSDYPLGKYLLQTSTSVMRGRLVVIIRVKIQTAALYVPVSTATHWTLRTTRHATSVSQTCIQTNMHLM